MSVTLVVHGFLHKRSVEPRPVDARRILHAN